MSTTTTPTDPTAAVLPPRERLEVSALLNEMQEAITHSSEFIERMENNDIIKSCWWEGQSDDGRKHADDIGEEPTPYEGASDQRLRIADMLVQERVELCKAAMVGGRMSAEAADSAKTPTAARQAPMLNYQFGQMKVMLRDETDYLLDWMNTYGLSILGVDWQEERRLEHKIVTIDNLISLATDADLAEQGLPTEGEIQELAAMQMFEVAAEAGLGQVPLPANDPALESQATAAAAMSQAAAEAKERSYEDVVALLLSDEKQPRLLELLQEFDEKMPDSEARRCVTQLRKGEAALYYVPYVHLAGPRWEALCPFVDVFFPAHVRKLQDSPWIARVHWLTAAQLRDHAELEGWDKEWVKEVLKKPGPALELASRKWVLSGSAVRMSAIQPAQSADQKLFQVLEVHYVATALEGAGCLYRDVIHGGVKDRSAFKTPECLPDWHGCLPYVEFRRRRKGARYLVSSEGIPEEMMTHQSAIKAQHDARTNRTDLILHPPVIVPNNRAGGQFSVAPGAQIPMRRSGVLDYLKPPQMDMDTVAITREEWHMINMFYGRPADDVPDAVVWNKQQAAVNDFLTDLGEACKMTYDLCLEHIPDETWQAITGSPKPALDRRHSEFQITFDVRVLNLDWLKEVLGFYTSFVLPQDSEGVIDRAAMVDYVFSSIDPQIARLVVRGKEDAAASEEEDELTALAIIMAGEEPLQKPNQNHALRAQVLQRAAQRSVEIQGKLATNAQIMEVYKARLQFHLNQVQQQQNAIIGRTMQQPVLGEPQQ